jgi:hypothetical protein
MIFRQWAEDAHRTGELLCYLLETGCEVLDLPRVLEPMPETLPDDALVLHNEIHIDRLLLAGAIDDPLSFQLKVYAGAIAQSVNGMIGEAPTGENGREIVEWYPLSVRRVDAPESVTAIWRIDWVHAFRLRS